MSPCLWQLSIKLLSLPEHIDVATVFAGGGATLLPLCGKRSQLLVKNAWALQPEVPTTSYVGVIPAMGGKKEQTFSKAHEGSTPLQAEK